MKRYIVLALTLLMSLSSAAMAQPNTDENDTSRDLCNQVKIINDTGSIVYYSFGRVPDLQDMIPLSPKKTAYYPSCRHTKLLLFVYYRGAENDLLFHTDFNLYDTHLMDTVRISSPEKQYAVTCLQGDSKSCTVK